MQSLRPSILELVQECPRKYSYLEKDRITTEGEAVSTRFGTAWHEIKRLRSLGATIDEALAQVTLEVGPDEYRNKEKLMKAELHYLKRYGGPIVPLSPKHLELETLQWIEGVPVPLLSHMDCVAMLDVNEGTGVEKWVVDYKTTSRLESDWVSSYRVSNQFKAYYAAAKIEHPDIAGVICDLLHVTKGLTTERGQKGKSQEQIDGVHLYRLPIRYSDYVIDEWRQTMKSGWEAIQKYEADNFYPLHAPIACKAYGSTCPFLDICDTQDPARRELIKLNSFVKRQDEEPTGA